MNGHMTLEGLLKLLRRNLKTLFAWLVGTLTITILFTFFIMVPQYQSTSRIVVNQTEDRMSNITSTDITTNISLMKTYQNIMMEPIILDDVIAETGADETLREMHEKITFQNEEESLVFGVTVRDENPQMAANIANTTTEIFQDKIGDILPVESVTILSEAVPDSEQVSPNILQNIFLGFLMGIFIGFTHIFLKALLDKRVKNSEIINDLGWLNLGTISEMTSREIHHAQLPAPEEKSEENLNIKQRVEKVRF
jgi:capsular polysaccharide biosynthesis protein